MPTALLASAGVIQVTGDDATAFLHAQFTADLTGLAPGHATPAAWCTAKGRVLATFIALRRTDDWLLVTERELLPALIRRLTMFVLRSKVRVSDASAQWRVLGLSAGDAVNGDATARDAGAGDNSSGDTATGRAPWPLREVDGGLAIVFEAGHGLALAPVGPVASDTRAGEAAVAASGDNAPEDASRWRAAEIAAGRAWVRAATQDAWTPQMLNLDLIGAVSFTKGCYPGQEIVARTRYLGRVKRRLLRASAEAGTPAVAGTPIVALGGESIGEVFDAAIGASGRQALLLVAQLDALEAVRARSVAEPDLRLGSTDGPQVRLEPLPYALDDDAPHAPSATHAPA